MSISIKIDEASNYNNWEKVIANIFKDLMNLEEVSQYQIIEEDPNDEDYVVKGFKMVEDIYNKYHLALTKPTNLEEALRIPKSKVAMEEELRVVEKNKTWRLIDKPIDKHACN